jgi:glycosyltransferase involved in cell wall biosynthesis
MSAERHQLGAKCNPVKLIFLNRFFYPDHSATSQMLADVAFGLAKRGQEVSVITSRLRYDAAAERLPTREMIDGVTVYRIWTTRFGRLKLLGRAIDYATFYVSATWRLWRLARTGDVVVAKTDPPMLTIIAAPICGLRGARLVSWLQDIFPETAEALGVGGRPARLAYGALRKLRDRSLGSAVMSVVLGERMAETVWKLGIQRERVRIIQNWADGNVIRPVDHGANELRTEWRLADTFVVGYSGNLGRAHEIETLLEAMTILERARQDQPGRLLWLFVGDGALFGQLRAQVEERALTSVRFKPYQPSKLLVQSLSAADVHLVSLRPNLEGLIVPSKFYAACAAGRPTIFIGSKDGEISRLICRHQCGRVIEVGDGPGLAHAVLELARDPVALRQMGERARRACEVEFDKSIALEQWEKLLLEVCNPGALADQRTLPQEAILSVRKGQ